MFKVGDVVSFYPKTMVSIISLTSDLFLGENVNFVFNKDLVYKHKVTSIKMGTKNVDFAKAGSVVGLKLNEKVQEGTEVFKS